MELNELLAEARDKGVEAIAMEVSSHALAEKRVDGVEFDAAVFTNLTQDHLDFHGSMEAYEAAKLRLFTELPKQSAKPFKGGDQMLTIRSAYVGSRRAGWCVAIGLERARCVAGSTSDLIATTSLGRDRHKIVARVR